MASIERLLVPFDGTPLAEASLENAFDAYPDAEITVLHVIDYVEESSGAGELVGSAELRDRAPSQSSDLLGDAVAEARGRDVETTTRVGEPAREIVAYAEAHDVDTIVIGNHGRLSSPGSSWARSPKPSSGACRRRCSSSGGHCAGRPSSSYVPSAPVASTPSVPTGSASRGASPRCL